MSDELWKATWEGFVLQLMIQPRYETMMATTGRSLYTPQFIELIYEGLAEAKSKRATFANQS